MYDAGIIDYKLLSGFGW